ncbi:hypothetical protein D3C79_616540 [compost metagenome]
MAADLMEESPLRMVCHFFTVGGLNKMNGEVGKGLNAGCTENILGLSDEVFCF